MKFQNNSFLLEVLDDFNVKSSNWFKHAEAAARMVFLRKAVLKLCSKFTEEHLR